MKYSLIVFLAFVLFINCKKEELFDKSPLIYYIDSVNGNDSKDGLSISTPWQNLSMLEETAFYPGDTIRFKRGSEYSTPLHIEGSGDSDNYIVLCDYGDKALAPPSFTNTVFDIQEKNFGNCIRLKGSYILVEDLYFHSTVAELSGRIGFELMWELGAVYVDKEAENCIVRNNEFNDCGVGIKSYGPHTLIDGNYIHDCNRILKEWSWGPLAIWLGGDFQEVSNNRIHNYRVVDPMINWGPGSYGGGADGGVIEIDDGRYPKSNISIHHNYSTDNQGFIEVTWTDLVQNPPYEGFLIHHNISDDYQQFIVLWTGAKCRIEHNTIIRRKINVNDWGVFNITQYNANNYIRNNIIVVEGGVVVFNLGRDGNAQPNNIISNNLYYAAAGKLDIGLEGPGESPIFSNPLFLNYAGGARAIDFSISSNSPAINKGIDLAYKIDYSGIMVPVDILPDIGAFQYIQRD
jgi:hypothetical protein